MTNSLQNSCEPGSVSLPGISRTLGVASALTRLMRQHDTFRRKSMAQRLELETLTGVNSAAPRTP